MSTAVYLRVSSRQQDVESQRPDLERWVAAQGCSAEWFEDRFTGRSMDRPGWNRLMEGVREGRINRVVCWRLDRLGRTARGLTALFDEFQTARVNLVSLKDGIDLSTPAGRMLANVLASVAQFETEIRSERVAAGHAAARARGVRWGGSQKGRKSVFSPSLDQVEAIRRLRAERVPVAQIARAVRLSRPTVYSYLKPEVAQ